MDDLEDDDDGRDDDHPQRGTPPPPDDRDGGDDGMDDRDADHSGDDGGYGGDDNGGDEGGGHPGPHDVPEEYARHFVKCMAHHGLVGKYERDGDAGTGGDLPLASRGKRRGGDDTEKMRKQRMRKDSGAMKQSRFENAVMARLDRLQKEVETVVGENRDLAYERDQEQCERMIQAVESEDYQLDRAVEVERMVAMTADQRQAHVKYIRRHYAKSPAGRDSVRVKDDRPTISRTKNTNGRGNVVSIKGGSEGRTAKDIDESLDYGETDKVLAYMRANNMSGDADWRKARKIVLGEE